ncbi:MAG: hypothetical protein K0U35_03155 [Actinomycetia bacterium]|nr:hypothetical protein [Actinomycetes bacterium]
MSDTAIKRPAGVTIVGILTAILGVINIVFGVWMLMYWLGIKLGTLFDGQLVNQSALWLMFNGFLAVVMGLIYFWLTQLTFAGSQTAQVLISVFAVINIVFGFFHFDSGGAAQIILNLIVVLIVNTHKAKLWFSQTA